MTEEAKWQFIADGKTEQTGLMDQSPDALLGIGDESGKKIVYAMFRAELIDKEFEAYKEVSDHEYLIAKYKRMRETAEED